MFNSNFFSSNKLNYSSNREEPKEDSGEALGATVESLVEEMAEIGNPSSVIHVGYLGTIKENVLMRSVLTVKPVIIMLKIVLS